ncbi:MAG TPA: hypothetical protein VF752_17095, partial [Thermoleophilaceae bacterium]
SRRIRFALSEPARLTGSVKKGARRVQKISITGRKGTNSVKLSRKLKAGRYRLTLKAVDAAGNTSKTFTKTFRLGR